jgi:hypothetical protein
MLARAAELCLSLAEHLHAELLTAEPADKPALTKAVHTALRSLRQSIALRRRVEREMKAEARKAENEALTIHKARIRAPIAWQIWNEYETSDAALSAEFDLDDVLDEAVLAEDFLTIPVDQHIATICQAMDIAIPAPLPTCGERPDIAPPSPIAGEGVGRTPDG